MVNLVNIQLFAVLKENLGESIRVNLDENITSRKLLDLLAKHYPENESVFMASRVANGDIIINDGDLISTEKIIGILPPASGG